MKEFEKQLETCPYCGGQTEYKSKKTEKGITFTEARIRMDALADTLEAKSLALALAAKFNKLSHELSLHAYDCFSTEAIYENISKVLQTTERIHETYTAKLNANLNSEKNIIP